MSLLSTKNLIKHTNSYSSLSMAIALSLGLFISGCTENKEIVIQGDGEHPQATEQVNDSKTEQLNKQALELAKKYIIADTHIDVPYRLEEEYEDISAHTAHGDFDYPRAIAGGLNAPFMSIYIPAQLEETGGSKALADKLIDMVETIVKDSPEKFALAYSTQDLADNFAKGLISLPMGMENGSPIEGDLNNLAHFYERGIRYITLTHSKANHISDSSYDSERPAKGLTDFGKNLITEMNNIGVMVDVSHISDDAFYQVMEISKTPVIASHSSARHFTPEFERNMSDDMIKLLAQNGGVIQINFGSTFVHEPSRQNYNAYKQAVSDFAMTHNVDKDSEQVKAFAKEYREKIPFVYATLDQVLDHFDHVVKLVGIDHVGIGSDYDGVGDSLPENLKDVASYPRLIAGFLARGYSEDDIEKILSGNLVRVWKAVEVYAAEH